MNGPLQTSFLTLSVDFLTLAVLTQNKAVAARDPKIPEFNFWYLKNRVRINHTIRHNQKAKKTATFFSEVGG